MAHHGTTPFFQHKKGHDLPKHGRQFNKPESNQTRNEKVGAKLSTITRTDEVIKASSGNSTQESR